MKSSESSAKANSLQVLVSAMMQANTGIIRDLKIQSDLVLINQTDINSTRQFEFNNHSVIWIDSKTRGLSKSRNLALQNSSADICVLADDDLIYVDGYKQHILNAFDTFPDADILAFMVDGIDGEFKKYSNHPKRLNLITSMKVASVQIAFRRKSIIENDIGFNENFGAGAKFSSGEENIFLANCLNKNLKLYFVPIKIADVYLGDSTWFTGFNQQFFITKGATLTAISKSLSIPFIVQYATRKKKLYAKEMSFSNALRYMLLGRQKFINHDFS